MKTHTKPIIVIVLLAYAFAFHIGLEQRHEAERSAQESARIVAEASRGASYARQHNGEWPELDTAAWAYKSGSTPEHYELEYLLKTPANDGTQPMLLGHLGWAPAATLKPVAPAKGYFYLGYAVTSEEQGLALVDAVRNGKPLAEDIPVADGQGSFGSSSLYRLRDNLIESLAKDSEIGEPSRVQPKDIPVIVQRPVDSFMWVVYLDQHAARIPYPGLFPASQEFMAALEAAHAP